MTFSGILIISNVMNFFFFLSFFYCVLFCRLDLDACKSRLRKARSQEGQTAVSGLFIYLFIYSFIHLFIHSFTHCICIFIKFIFLKVQMSLIEVDIVWFQAVSFSLLTES